MSYFDDASLVLIPSGYKDQKIFSVKPLDGSGDLTFSRASNATRVGPDGLIEKVRTNVVLYSQDFSNAAWSKSAGTTLTHSQTDPNGGTTATRVVMTSGTNNFFTQAITGNGVRFNTLSVWIKGVTTGGTLSLNTGTAASRTGTTITYTTDWVRYQIIQNETTSNTGFQIDNFSNSVGQVAGDFLIAFAQVETSDFGATAYIATTTAAVSVGPVSGLPRLDYLNSSCPRLLLEPQRTNSATFSEQLDNAAWTKVTGTTVTANQAVSPDGYQNADLITFSQANTEIRQTISGLTAVTSTASIYLKAPAGQEGRTVLFGYANSNQQTVTLTSEWQRVIVTQTNAFNNNVYIGNYSGQTATSVLAWGFQVELNAAYATSYIPTLSTSVTRVADAAFKTSATAIIGQTEGTFFAEVDFTDTNADQMYLTLSDGTTNNRIHIGFDNASNWLYCNIRASGAAQGLITSSAPTSGVKKIAVGYKLNDYVLYINGVQVGVDGSALVPACTRVDVGGYFSAGFEYPVKQALLFKTRLTNAQLAELTTL